jgi:hypothetical protein
LYKSNTEGIRLMHNILKNKTTNRQGVMPNAGVLKDAKGNHAPMYTKQAQLSTVSKTAANGSFSVCSPKCPSQEMALPDVR